ncbi:hypothetical protein [Streptomyces sp. UG1]|uniref:hypothetical protein n=1 Tax=Streptomyces sp. UG1 TaxID=3417652 RepID=UPI003CFB7DB3
MADPDHQHQEERPVRQPIFSRAARLITILLTVCVVALAAIVVWRSDTSDPLSVRAGEPRQPTLKPGGETLVDFRLPEGYNTLAATLLLTRTAGNVAECPAEGQPVDIRSEDGSADPGWRLQGAVDDALVEVPIAKSADALTLSLAMSGTGNCQYESSCGTPA